MRRSAKDAVDFLILPGRRPWVMVIIVFCGALVLYGSTLAPGVLGGDAGELQFAPAILALPHPSGYPVQSMLNWLWLHLFPFGETAWRLNLLSALVSAAAVAMVAGLVSYATRSPLAGAAAALALGQAPVVWSQAVLSDKYAFNGFLTACLLAAIYRFIQRRDRQSLGLVGLVTGLAFAHHRSLWVFGPALAGLLLLRERRLLRSPAAWLWGGVAFVLPFLLYLYVPWTARRPLPPAYGIEMDWDRFWQYVLTDGSAGQVRFAPDMAGLHLYGQWLLQSFPLWWLIPLAVGGVVPACLWAAQHWARVQDRGRQQERPVPRYLAAEKGSWLLFLVAAYVLSAYFSAIYENYDLPRRYVYFVPSFVVLAALLGEGWAAACNVASWSGRRPLRRLMVGSLAVLALAPLILLPARWSEFRAEQGYEAPLDIWRQTLKHGGTADRMAAALALVAPRALIVADWEQATPLWYAQQIDGYCPDCRIVYPLHDLISFAGQAAEQERPLYVARTVADAALWSNPQAAGPLVALAPEVEKSRPAAMRPLDLWFNGHLVLAGYTWPLGEPEIGRGRLVPISLIWQRTGGEPLPDYAISLRLTGPDGEIWKADNPSPVLGMHPFSAFEPGEVVADYYEIPIPANGTPGNYTLQLVLYDVASDGEFRNAQITGPGEIQGTDRADILTISLTE